MKPIIRILASIFALGIGIAVLYALTYVGEKTKGPIEDVFSSVAETVRQAEENAIIENRSESRADQLTWLKTNSSALRNPSKILLGAYDSEAINSLRTIFDLEKSIGVTFPLVQIYTAWGSKEEQKFPAIKIAGILKSGSIPVITWEPWLTDFDNGQFENQLRPVETRDKNGLTDIALGQYDKYIRYWARAAASVKQPIFLRFGHEMNDPYRYPWGPQNNQPDDFKAAWRHVHKIFQEEKAHNVLWIWSPHPAHGLFEAYYPGDAVVDWVGVGALNYGTVAPWSQWWTFDEIFGNYYEELCDFGKPIMISEFGSLAVGGDRKIWYSTALSSLQEKYPQVKSLLFFHVSHDQTTTQQPLDWSIRHDASIIRVVSSSVKNWK